MLRAQDRRVAGVAERPPRERGLHALGQARDVAHAAAQDDRVGVADVDDHREAARERLDVPRDGRLGVAVAAVRLLRVVRGLPQRVDREADRWTARIERLLSQHLSDEFQYFGLGAGTT